MGGECRLQTGEPCRVLKLSSPGPFPQCNPPEPPVGGHSGHSVGEVAAPWRWGFSLAPGRQCPLVGSKGRLCWLQGARPGPRAHGVCSHRFPPRIYYTVSREPVVIDRVFKDWKPGGAISCRNCGEVCAGHCSRGAPLRSGALPRRLPWDTGTRAPDAVLSAPPRAGDYR